jgi:hypothetical protein
MPLFNEQELREKGREMKLKLEIPSNTQIARAAAKTNTNPTEKQQEAGNYRKGAFRWHGLEIKIENPKGSTRSGTDRDGKKWESTMRHHYGYIARTNGYDGDQVDVFIGPYPASTQVYVVNQVDPADKDKFDEHKCMIGFKSADAAKKAYLANYEKHWQGLGSLQQMSIADFKRWTRTKGKKNGPQAGALKKIALMMKFADINLDIDKGDTMLVGRFKNKRITVDEIGEDELNQPTVNGRKLLTGRIEKTMPKGKLNKKAFMAGYHALT